MQRFIAACLREQAAANARTSAPRAHRQQMVQWLYRGQKRQTARPCIFLARAADDQLDQEVDAATTNILHSSAGDEHGRTVAAARNAATQSEESHHRDENPSSAKDVRELAGQGKKSSTGQKSGVNEPDEEVSRIQLVNNQGQSRRGHGGLDRN
ncbi:hypothetical protein JX265_007915 [Neoarthrinium moseri]|uniref:Uncharacterized protein n=1 Tax=Neoarthrinium moseri TaxID=1658444 RepID=A0A9P9WIX7_9PEZI|nr:hypothetical protein JX265_007915 [Neoarthrinium moseri]